MCAVLTYAVYPLLEDWGDEFDNQLMIVKAEKESLKRTIRLKLGDQRKGEQ